MSYPEFIEIILESLKELVPEDITMTHITVEKLNGFVRHGIMFKRAEVNYAPTVYLEPFYKSFQNGHSVEYLARELYRSYQEETSPVPDCIHLLKRFEDAKEHIFCRLVHIKENERLLKEVPHVIFLDFAVIPYFEVTGEQIYKGSILLKKEYLSCWDIKAEELLEWAIEHTRAKKGMLFSSMEDMLADYLDQEDTEFYGAFGRRMYVLTNREKYLGAVLVYFPDVLESIRQLLDEDYYLLPSSVHEWIIVPTTQISEEKLLLDIVRQVNKSEVMEEEVLSNDIYYYSGSLQKIYNYKHINDKND